MSPEKLLVPHTQGWCVSRWLPVPCLGPSFLFVSVRGKRWTMCDLERGRGWRGSLRRAALAAEPLLSTPTRFPALQGGHLGSMRPLREASHRE